MKTFAYLSLCAVTALAASGSVARGALLTYDLRIAPQAQQPTGVSAVDSHDVLVTAPGQVVQLQLWVIIQNSNSDQTDDGFETGQGSFVSSPAGPSVTKLQGTLRGAGTSTLANTLNNVSPFKSTGATSGAPSDYEGDGIVDDVGRNSTGTGDLNDWFLATSGSSASLGTDPANSNNLAQLIGRTTFTTGPAPNGLISVVDFIPRLLTSGSDAVQQLHLFSSDGVDYTLRGDDVNIAHIGSTIIDPPVPEPSSLLLFVVGISRVIVLRRRRS